jgi:CDGSH-type Zn-finger protein
MARLAGSPNAKSYRLGECCKCGEARQKILSDGSRQIISFRIAGACSLSSSV